AASIGADVSYHRSRLANSVIPLKQQHHHAPPPTGFGIRGEILKNIIVNEFLNLPVLRVVRRNGLLRVLGYQVLAGCKHAGTNQFQPRSCDETTKDSPSARLVERIWSDYDVRELLRHSGYLVEAGLGVCAAGAAGAGAAAAFPPKILNITVPQVGHLPLMALRPFFIVSSTASMISFFALHLTQ